MVFARQEFKNLFQKDEPVVRFLVAL
jgi:hypothetical protein